MHIVHATIAETIASGIVKSRGVMALAMRAAIVGGCAMFVCACATDQQQVAASKLNEKAVEFAVLSQEAASRKNLPAGTPSV